MAGQANKGQLDAINTTEGPVLIIAGPGTGKTYTLVQRTIRLISECGVKPDEIFLTTFTAKAAKELLTRITSELSSRSIVANVKDMYIGTFHSLCLRIIKEHLEYSRLKKNYHLLDGFAQTYTIYRNMWSFSRIAGFDKLFENEETGHSPTQWQKAVRLAEMLNTLNEECVDTEALSLDDDPLLAVLGKAAKCYAGLLADGNLLDFATIQRECLRILEETPIVLETLQEKLRYLMIDEYQDTNYIQERLVFLLAGARKNICVVGDDDQGLYRFRGATIRNILEFPAKFMPGECREIHLNVNYRSYPAIVDFYNRWMSETEGERFKFEWENFRFPKCLKANRSYAGTSSPVAKLSGIQEEDEWHRKVLDFIRGLKEEGHLQDYNQVAILCKSVKADRVVNLVNFLEKNGVSVYSPRSDMFFQRDEIRYAIGFVLLMFPGYLEAVAKGEYKYLSKMAEQYYLGCAQFANAYLKQEDMIELRHFVKKHGLLHHNLQKSTDYAYAALLYQLFAFRPFIDWLDVDLGHGVLDSRAARNLSRLSQLFGQFEYLHNVSVLTPKTIRKSTENLFNTFLRCLLVDGLEEYEDESEYAPSGCVSFMTIHQAKGMEFPIVLVDSLGSVPRIQNNAILKEVEAKYYKRKPFEPTARIKYFDFWRLYYTAFSRAQDLLVLTCNEDKHTPCLYFRELYEELPKIDSPAWNSSDFDFQCVKNAHIKPTFSFTSHITVYETCARQYKFYKELEFLPVRQGAMLFGRLVHETIEDIHRAALRGDSALITPDNIRTWLNTNYASLVRSEHSYLVETQREIALKQILRYAERQNGNWVSIREAEVDVSCVQPDYIIEGCVDLIRGEGDTVELVDFKSERKPDIFRDKERIERYRRQLQLYAWLVEQRTGHRVSKMHLYYTGEEDGNPRITFPYTKTAIEGTLAAFDDTVRNILSRNFSHCADSEKICRACDFRFFCHNK